MIRSRLLGPRAAAAFLRLAALAGGLAWAAPAAAQSVGVPVRALVGNPVTVTAQQDLLFTTVFPGFDKVVSPTTGGAAGAMPAMFRIQGKPGDEVRFYFDFPPGGALVSGANSLPIDAWQACMSTTGTSTSCIAFTPSSSGHVARLNAPGTPAAGRLFIRLGATVHPALTQPAGTYTGVVTLSAVYTGL